MLNRTGFVSPESTQRSSLEYEQQRLILHNSLIQRILKLRDKLSSTISLTELSTQLDDLEKSIYSGGNLDQIDQEIKALEKTVSLHLNRLLQFLFFEENSTPEDIASQAILYIREVNKSEKVW